MNATYSAHFSFYGEDYGSFGDTVIKFGASDIFEARQRAWELCKENEDMKFCSNLKLCGITWEATPLNLQDYFNAASAYEKCHIKKIENVKIPNLQLDNDLSSISDCKREKERSLGSLESITNIAKDFSKGYVMTPPHIFEELHYTYIFIDRLYRENKYEQANALSNIVLKAEKWDQYSMYEITNLFKNKYIFLADDIIRLGDEFGISGIYPECEDVYDRADKYISRWKNAIWREKLSALPIFGEQDVIHNSDSMPFVDYTLVVKQEKLKDEWKNPLNSLWSQEYDLDSNFATEPDTWITVRNMITGKVCSFMRKDFHGILRPDIANKIDFIAIKNEYQELLAQCRSDENLREAENTTGITINENDWEDDLEQ